MTMCSASPFESKSVVSARLVEGDGVSELRPPIGDPRRRARVGRVDLDREVAGRDLGRGHGRSPFLCSARPARAERVGHQLADRVGLGVERLFEPVARAPAAELPLGVGVDEAGVAARCSRPTRRRRRPRAAALRGQRARCGTGTRRPADSSSRSPPRSSASRGRAARRSRAPRSASHSTRVISRPLTPRPPASLGFRGARGAALLDDPERRVGQRIGADRPRRPSALTARRPPTNL